MVVLLLKLRILKKIIIEPIIKNNPVRKKILKTKKKTTIKKN